ncbi:T9SS type A sorting domain-containing protein, partial [uncultured Chryseobacterium sp.]
QVFDASGKIVADQSFSGSDAKISIDVQHLPKGTYIYRIGNASAKFTKN